MRLPHGRRQTCGCCGIRLRAFFWHPWLLVPLGLHFWLCTLMVFHPACRLGNPSDFLASAVDIPFCSSTDILWHLTNAMQSPYFDVCPAALYIPSQSSWHPREGTGSEMSKQALGIVEVTGNCGTFCTEKTISDQSLPVICSLYSTTHRRLFQGLYFKLI